MKIDMNALPPSRRRTRRRDLARALIMLTREACAFVLDGWDVQLSALGRAATPRSAGGDGDGSLSPVAFAA